jgi:hypothetical protein
MGFDVGFDAGSSTFEAVEAEEFVSNELKIAWCLEGNEFAEKGNDRGGPGAAMVAAAGFDLKSLAVLEPASSKLVEAGFSYMETLAGFWDSNPAGVEFMKGLQNELTWESAGELAFFIAPIDRIQLALGTPDFRSLCGGASPPACATLRPPPSPRQKAGQWLFRAKCSFPLLNRRCSLLNRRRQHSLFSSITKTHD